MIKIKNKKSMTAATIITLTVLILSFAIILFFWYQINWQGNVDRETCHASVVLRASATLGKFDAAKASIPLKCKTEEWCLTSGFFGSDCSNLGKDYNKERVTSKEEVLDFMAEEMYSWHKILGEGKINYMERKTLNENYCILGTILSIDQKARDSLEGESITFFEIYENLERKKTPEGTSYLQEMYGVKGVDDLFRGYPDDFSQKLTTSMDLNKNYILLTQLSNEGYFNTHLISYAAAGVVALVGGLAVVAAIPSGGSSLAVAAVIIGGTLKVATATAITYGVTFYGASPDPSEKFTYSPPQWILFDSDHPEILESFKCDEINSLA